jgi:valacyclovir hydrolase
MMHITTLNNTTLAYRDIGRGSPVLLIHGFTGTASSDLPLLIDDLQHDHRVLAPDLRGYGASRPPARDFPPNFYERDADDMIALLEHVQAGPTAVLGFSDGAEVALLVAARRPDLVRAVVAWGVAGVITSAMVDSVQSWKDPLTWETRHAAWRDEIIELHGQEQFPAMVYGWVAGTEAILAAGGDIVLNSAHQISCPVLLMNGDGEVGNPPEDVQRLAARIPHSRLEFVANSGHSIHRDQPVLFMQLVRDFLRTNAD